MTNNRETTAQMMNTIFPERVTEHLGMRQYLESGCWRCDSRKSPTGAHYWKDLHGHSGRFQCIYCGEKRSMGVEGAVSPVGHSPTPKKHAARKTRFLGGSA
jgi:hypothetical protein